MQALAFLFNWFYEQDGFSGFCLIISSNHIQKRDIYKKPFAVQNIRQSNLNMLMHLLTNDFTNFDVITLILAKNFFWKRMH